MLERFQLVGSTTFTQERSIPILFGGSFCILLLDLSFSIAKKKSPILFEFPFFLNSLTKFYVVSNFYFDLVIFKVLQSIVWWLDTVGSRAAKPQVRFCIFASLWDWILCDG